eukprot:2821413-Amphidinium_carterae.1
MPQCTPLFRSLVIMLVTCFGYFVAWLLVPTGVDHICMPVACVSGVTATFCIDLLSQLRLCHSADLPLEGNEGGSRFQRDMVLAAICPTKCAESGHRPSQTYGSWRT